MYQQRPGFTIGSGMTPAVKYLLIANIVVFGLQVFLGEFMITVFSLVPVLVFPGFQIWRVMSYMFLHGNFSHILFNMIGLFFFGPPLERYLGTRQFYYFYFICGVGAGVACVPFYLLLGGAQTVIIGASGAIFGVLVGYGVLYPNSTILLGFILPVKAKWLVIFYGAMEFFATVSYTRGEASGVASVAHLAGLVIGYLYLRRFRDLKRLIPWVRFRYIRYKQRRKFRVIRDRDDGFRGPPTYH